MAARGLGAPEIRTRAVIGFQKCESETGDGGEAASAPAERSGNADSRPTLLTLEGSNAQPLSMRAKALIFADPATQALLTYIERIAASDAPILVFGETGTGKELLARHAHQLSGRKGPFLALNCGAISENLAESEFFGHEAGAFTGAGAKREGWFEAANKGTLFLDEIADLPLPLQVKLLRVLQEREIVRVGSRRPIPVDVRLIFATNVDLNEAVAAGRFRLDLFYRINLLQIRVPPLRDRPGDILPLANHFLAAYSKRLNLPERVLTAKACEALQRCWWSGNIRELENVIHLALLVATGREIGPEHLRLAGGVSASPPIAAREHHSPFEAIKAALAELYRTEDANLFHDLEGLIVDDAYRHCRFNQVQTASLLGISRNILRTLLKKHGLLAQASRSQSPVGKQTAP